MSFRGIYELQRHGAADIIHHFIMQIFSLKRGPLKTSNSRRNEKIQTRYCLVNYSIRLCNAAHTHFPHPSTHPRPTPNTSAYTAFVCSVHM